MAMVKWVRPPIADEVVAQRPRQPSVEELTELVDAWLVRAAHCLWRGDINGGAGYFMAAADIALKLDIESVDLGVRLGYWDFSRLVDWVDEARAAAPRTCRP
jgi:hypothetical protein